MYRPTLTILPKKYVSSKGNELKLKSIYCTDFNFSDEDVKEFRCSTVNGKIFINKGKIVIPQIYNDEQNNGAFAETLEVLLELAHDLQRDLWIINFMNLDFKKHLIKKRGFICKMYEKRHFDGVYYPWEKLYEEKNNDV